MGAGGIEIVATGAALCLCRLGFRRFARTDAYAFVLIGVSIALLWWWHPAAMVVTLALLGVVLGYLALTRDARLAASTRLLGGTVTLLLAPLVFFKYVPWLAGWTAQDGAWSGANWLVPLGLSFTTFRLIGVVMDRHALKIAVSPARVILMGLFFPTFQAGPITSLQNFGPLEASAPTVRATVSPGAARILLGLLRKVVLADPLYRVVIGPWLDGGVSTLQPDQALILPVLLGMYIYWDFAGYSDIAIGAAHLAGYRVPENFNRPYFSSSVVDFWRRWHITLSEWIRLRLMMKMVHRRSPTSHMYAAMLVSMALCGLWHGAGLNFIVWGLWHGLGLVGVHVFGGLQRRSQKLFDFCQSEAWRVLAVVLTFTFVTAGWIVFFLPLDQAFALCVRAMAYRPSADAALLHVIGVFGSLLIMLALGDRPGAAWARMPALARGLATSAAGAVIAYLLLFHGQASQEFVYSQF